jgi:hypothetical protein
VLADLRNALRRPAGTGAAGRALPLALVLAVLVVAAAGLAGTAHLTGPRWYPNLRSSPGVRTTPLVHLPPSSQTKTIVKARGASGSWLLAVVIAVVLVVLANLMWRWLRGRRLAPASPNVNAAVGNMSQVVGLEPEPEPARLLTGIELALQALAEQREPADAVVRAWLGLQETAEESGIVRRVSETPTEFTERVLTRAFADPEPLHTLLRLYLRTRFGDHPVTADDVRAVHDALQQLLAGWHAATDAAGPAVGAR